MKEYNFEKPLFYVLESYEIKRNNEGEMIEESKIEGFPRLDLIRKLFVQFKDKSLPEILDEFAEQGNEILDISGEFNPVYSVLGLRYTVDVPQDIDSQNGLVKLNEGMSRHLRGLELKDTESKNGVLFTDDNEVIITLEKYLDLGKPAKLTKNRNGVILK